MSDAKALTEILVHSELNQQQLAARCGMPRSVLSDVLRGRRVLSRWQIGRICAVCGISPLSFAFDMGEAGATAGVRLAKLGRAGR